jgi:hypothetical protein
MVEFETLESEEIEFGRNNFIQVTRKRAIPDEGEPNQFVGLTRGYFTEDGERRFRRNFAIPLEEEVIEFVTEHIPAMFELDADEYRDAFDDEDDFEDDFDDDDFDDDDEDDFDDDFEDDEPEAIY